MIKVKVGNRVRITKIDQEMRSGVLSAKKKGEIVEITDVNEVAAFFDMGWVNHGCYEIISTADQSTPSHYAEQNGVACIDAIRAQLGRDGFIAFCRGNIAKYNWRLLQKGSVKADADKLADYARMLAKELEQ